MDIELNSLTLTNFKGIKSLRIDFKAITNAYGDNATGKTTIFDAFTWLLFGKDSTDRKDFEIKTLDENNKVIEKIDHEVVGVLTVAGSELVLKRVLREKWVKKRGTNDPEFTGNETLYFWNEAPMQQKEYQEEINKIIPERVFKLITSSLYFNSLSWQDRRKELIAIDGEMTDSDVAAGTPEFETLLISIKGKTIDKYKEEIRGKKKLLKESIETIPTRIDEATRSMPDPQDFTEIECRRIEKVAEVNKIDEQLTDATKELKARHDSVNAKQSEIHALNTQYRNIEFTVKSDFQTKKQNRESSINAVKQQIRTANDSKAANNTDYLNAEKRKEVLVKEQSELRGKWNAANAETFTFDESTCICPTCKQSLPAESIAEKKSSLEANFNNDKVLRLDVIKARGVQLGADIALLDERLKTIQQGNDGLNTTLKELSNNLATLENEHSRLIENEQQELTTAISTNAELQNINSKIEILQKEIEAINTPVPENVELKNRKAALLLEIDTLKKLLASEDQIKKTKTRIEELREEERSLAQQIADLEAKEFTIEKFTKAKIEALETRINSRFKYVRFKMFEQQINGGEVETCQTIYRGVPWSDLNNAARINCGLDIINTMCAHYEVKAPVFIDNAESITRLIPVESQIIRLVVSESDKKLRIETKTQEVAA